MGTGEMYAYLEGIASNDVIVVDKQKIEIRLFGFCGSALPVPSSDSKIDFVHFE